MLRLCQLHNKNGNSRRGDFPQGGRKGLRFCFFWRPSICQEAVLEAQTSRTHCGSFLIPVVHPALTQARAVQVRANIGSLYRRHSRLHQGYFRRSAPFKMRTARFPCKRHRCVPLRRARCTAFMLAGSFAAWSPGTAPPLPPLHGQPGSLIQGNRERPLIFSVSF